MRVMGEHLRRDVARDGHDGLVARRRFPQLGDRLVPRVVKTKRRQASGLSQGTPSRAPRLLWFGRVETEVLASRKEIVIRFRSSEGFGTSSGCHRGLTVGLETTKRESQSEAPCDPHPPGSCSAGFLVLISQRAERRGMKKVVAVGNRATAGELKSGGLSSGSAGEVQGFLYQAASGSKARRAAVSLIHRGSQRMLWVEGGSSKGKFRFSKVF